MKRNALAVGHFDHCVFSAPFFSPFAFLFFYINFFKPLWHTDLLQGFGYSMYMISGSMEIADLFSFCVYQLFADEIR